MNVDKMTIYRLKRAIPILFATALISGVFGHGCSGLEGAGSTSALCTTESVAVEAIENTLTASLVSGAALRTNLKSCMQYEAYYETDTTRLEEAEARREASFPETGSVTELTGPMMMGVVDLAGALCADLIDANDGAGSAHFSGRTLPEVVEIVGGSCWNGHAVEATESSEILNAVSDLDDRSAKLFICTSMLSSTFAVVQ